MAQQDIAWFVEELEEYSKPAVGRDDPALLRIVNALRRGNATEQQLHGYKSAALGYIAGQLRNDDPRRQRAFLQFLLQSEMLNDSNELRTALWDYLQANLPDQLDALSLSIAASLLESARAPAPTMARRMFSRVRSEHQAHPNWNYVGVLARMIGLTGEVPYSTDDLVNDIALLSDTPGFENALRARNATWMSVKPPLDAITVLTRVQRGQRGNGHRRPATPDFSFVDRVTESIVS